MQPIQQQATIADIETSREAHTPISTSSIEPNSPKRSSPAGGIKLDSTTYKESTNPQTWLKGKWQSPLLVKLGTRGWVWLTKSRNAYRYAIFIGLVVIAALCVASWFLAPKGENQVSVLVSAALRSPSSCDMTCGLANVGLLQALAVIADSRHRELLPDVGHHFHGPTAPPYCAETNRHS